MLIHEFKGRSLLRNTEEGCISLTVEFYKLDADELRQRNTASRSTHITQRQEIVLFYSSAEALGMYPNVFFFMHCTAFT